MNDPCRISASITMGSTHVGVWCHCTICSQVPLFRALLLSSCRLLPCHSIMSSCHSVCDLPFLLSRSHLTWFPFVQFLISDNFSRSDPQYFLVEIPFRSAEYASFYFLGVIMVCWNYVWNPNMSLFFIVECLFVLPVILNIFWVH